MKVARRAEGGRKVFIETRFASGVRRSGRRILVVLLPFLAALGFVPTVAGADAASPVQREILGLFFVILVFALIIGVLVHILLLAVVQWYRDSPRWRPGRGALRTHDKRLEIGWTVGPVVILALVVVLTLFALPNIERPRQYDYALDVIGAQWAWRYQYPKYTFANNTTVSVPDSSGTMYIQQGLTFLLRVHSEDVIHAFYVPDLGIKNIFWVRADIPGTYTAQCAEFCGVGHSQMHGTVVVFRPGTQAIPYGPPHEATQPGGGTPKNTIVDVQFRETRGQCYPDKQWSIEPCRLELGSNFNVTLRVWNNDTATHQFRIGAPLNLAGPLQPAKSAPAILNFNTGAPGQYAFWCDVGGHRGLGMEGILNVTGPIRYDIEIRDNSIRPNLIAAVLGQNLTATIYNNGSASHAFAIGPPYNTAPITISPGTSAPFAIVLNRTVPATYYGGDAAERGAGIVGELRVLAAGIPPPPPPPPAGFPIVQITFGVTGLAAVAALAFNFRLARAARRRHRFPPEEM